MEHSKAEKKTSTRLKGHKTSGRVSILAKRARGRPAGRKGPLEAMERLTGISGETRPEIEADLLEKSRG